MLRQECTVGFDLPDSGEALADPRRRVCWRRARDAAAAFAPDCIEPPPGWDWGFSDLAFCSAKGAKGCLLVQAHFPLRSACLEPRCVASPASPRAPRDSPSLTSPVSALAGLSLSTCPCCRSRFNGIRPQLRRQAEARAPPSSSRRSAIFVAGTPASAHFGPSCLRALPLARPPTAPRPQLTVLCLAAGSRGDLLIPRERRTPSSRRLTRR